MTTHPNKLPWRLRTRENFISGVSITWALIGLAVVWGLQLHYSGSVRIVEGLFGLLGGAIGGVLWSLVMWELMFKDRVRRLLDLKAGDANDA